MELIQLLEHLFGSTISHSPQVNTFLAPPLMFFLMSFLANLPIPSPSVFVATIWATTKRTVPPIAAHTAMSPHLGILNVYVCPPSVVFARIGDTPTNSALVDVVMVAMPSDMCLLIVWLKTLPRNRQHPSSQEDRFNHGIISLLRQGSMHIEPGSQLYDGGNITVLFLGSTLFLISSFCATSLLPGFLSYTYSIITIFLSWDLSHSLYTPSNPYAVPCIIARQGIFFASLFLVMDAYFSSQFSHISYILLLLLFPSLIFHDFLPLPSGTFYLVPQYSFAYSADLFLSI